MNRKEYRQRLLAEEQRLADRVERALAGVRESGDGAAHDVGDDSSTDELRDEQFAEAALHMMRRPSRQRLGTNGSTGGQQQDRDERTHSGSPHH